MSTEQKITEFDHPNHSAHYQRNAGGAFSEAQMSQDVSALGVQNTGDANLIKNPADRDAFGRLKKSETEQKSERADAHVAMGMRI